MLLIVLFVFLSLTFTSKDGWDRMIYGAFAVAMAVAIYYYRHDATISGWPWISGWRF